MHNSQVRVAIAGAGGCMGRHLIQASAYMDKITLGAVLEQEGSSLLKKDVGEVIYNCKTGVTIQSSLEDVKDDFDVFIDFTRPKGTLNHLEFCQKHKKGMVIGTTGFSDMEEKIIREVSNNIAIVFSANFSIGVNIMLILLEKTAKMIGKHTDIEIIEAHHRRKIDTPSATAIEMGKIMARSLDKNFQECAVYSREKKLGERISGTIGFATIRAGDIVGEHTAIFADVGERIEISHKASSRMIFANGALKSAVWIKEKKKGLFNMKDVLELSNL